MKIFFCYYFTYYLQDFFNISIKIPGNLLKIYSELEY